MAINCFPKITLWYDDCLRVEFRALPAELHRIGTATISAISVPLCSSARYAEPFTRPAAVRGGGLFSLSPIPMRIVLEKVGVEF